MRGEETVRKQVSGSRLVQRWTEIARSRGPQEVGGESAKPGLRLMNLETLLAWGLGWGGGGVGQPAVPWTKTKNLYYLGRGWLAKRPRAGIRSSKRT